MHGVNRGSPFGLPQGSIPSFVAKIGKQIETTAAKSTALMAGVFKLAVNKTIQMFPVKNFSPDNSNGASIHKKSSESMLKSALNYVKGKKADKTSEKPISSDEEKWKEGVEEFNKILEFPLFEKSRRMERAINLANQFLPKDQAGLESFEKEHPGFIEKFNNLKKEMAPITAKREKIRAQQQEAITPRSAFIPDKQSVKMNDTAIQSEVGKLMKEFESADHVKINTLDKTIAKQFQEFKSNAFPEVTASDIFRYMGTNSIKLNGKPIDGETKQAQVGTLFSELARASIKDKEKLKAFENELIVMSNKTPFTPTDVMKIMTTIEDKGRDDPEFRNLGKLCLIFSQKMALSTAKPIQNILPKSVSTPQGQAQEPPLQKHLHAIAHNNDSEDQKFESLKIGKPKTEIELTIKEDQVQFSISIDNQLQRFYGNDLKTETAVRTNLNGSFSLDDPESTVVDLSYHVSTPEGGIPNISKEVHKLLHYQEINASISE